ncbi:MmcQ/YjbR family DNA-binding protein [Actinomycetes bacterium KLBMP 9759]
MVTVDQVRAVVKPLPRSYEVLVRDRVKFRVGQIVYVAFSRDEAVMGFAFPKEERAALIASAPEKFEMPSSSDERFNWVHVRMAAIDEDEMRELVLDAWRMVVPKSVAAAHLG